MLQHAKKYLFLMVVMTMFCLCDMPSKVYAQSYSGSYDGSSTWSCNSAADILTYSGNGSCGDSSTWSFNTITGTLTFSGAGSITDNSGFEIYKDLIKTIQIKEGITSIGVSSCFEDYESLSSITFPSTLTEIKDYAFRNCTSLKSVTIPKSVTNAILSFDGSFITSISFEPGCTVIPHSVCSGAEYLEDVTIPDTVSKIDAYAFENCKALTSISLPETLTTIGSYAFTGTGIKSVALPKSVTSATLSFDNAQITSISFEPGCTVIPHAVCSGAGYLEDVIIPDTVSKIDAYAFENCKALTSISLPENLTTIGSYAFSGTGIKSLTLPKSVTSAALSFDNAQITSISFEPGCAVIPHAVCSGAGYLETVTIPDTVTQIDSYAFDNCKALTSISLPEALTTIGSYAFSGTGIKSMTLPKSVTSAALSFDNAQITSISFEPGCTVIPHAVCSGAEYLETVTIPSTVTQIESYAFENCNALTGITIPAATTKFGDYIFDGSGLKIIYGITNSAAHKYATENGFAFSSIGEETPKKDTPKKGTTYKVKSANLKFKITNASTNGKGTVSVAGLIKKASSVTIPKTVKISGYTYKVTAIEKKAFYKQSKLKKITIKSTTIKKIGSKAFTGIHKKAVIKAPKAKKSAYKKLFKKVKLTKTIKVKYI